MDTPEDSKDLFEIGYGGLLGIEQVQIGNYRVGRMIGQGTFGKVRLGINVKTNERVAIKCINKSSIANCEDSEFVYKEIFILTSLQHRNIIKLIEVLDTPSEIMLVMEYAGKSGYANELPGQTHTVFLFSVPPSLSLSRHLTPISNLPLTIIL